MTPFPPEHITYINIGYGLDGGGYSFENPPEKLGLPSCCLVWEDPDLDYILGADMLPHEHQGSAILLVFAPNSGHFEATKFPETLPGPWDDEDVYTRFAQGTLQSSDRECHCHGKLAEWTGAAGDPDKPLGAKKAMTWIVEEKAVLPVEKLDYDAVMWDFTGNVMDKPFPDCNRCDGEGLVDSPGGEWALYAVLQHP